MNEEMWLLIIAFFITTVPLLVGHLLIKKKIEEIHFSMLTNGLSKIADYYKVQTIKDEETGTPVKYLFYLPKVGLSTKKRLEIKRELCELPDADEFVIMEDYSNDKTGYTKLY
jgi:hypothetical protein